MTEEFETDVDEAGRLVLPPALARKYGLNPGTRIRIEDNANGLHLRRPVTQLARVYIEPTNRCNLNCVTCIRNSWDEPLGEMSSETFPESSKESVYPPPYLFWRLGEPLSHPHIVDMVREAKVSGFLGGADYQWNAPHQVAVVGVDRCRLGHAVGIVGWSDARKLYRRAAGRGAA